MAETLLRGVPTQYEPKLNNRFFLEFPQELDMQSWLVQTSDKPSIDITKTVIPYFNTESYVASRYKWNEMTITFIDTIGASSSQKIMEWVRLHSESVTGRMGYAAGYKKTLQLIAADGTGVGVEKWSLIECQVVNAKFDSFDYGGEEVIKPEITIQPYYCILEF